MNSQRKPLPLGQSDFAALISSGAIYADKTNLIFNLARDVEKVFIARPRRFGKSLLTSTFQSLFKFGLRDFKGLAIEGLWSDKTYPVVRLDFSEVSWFEDASEFRRKLYEHLEKGFGAAGFARTGRQSMLAALSSWLEHLPVHSLVVLIDEYDAPLTACFHQAARFEEVRGALSEFYSVLKSSSACLRFLFITGIVKVSSASLFSGINNLWDITSDPQYGTLLGYTEDEVQRCFEPYLSQAASLLGMTDETLVSELKASYDGFCFDETAQSHVFCPWSVLNFLKAPARGFKNYWYSSAGEPAVLRNYLQGHKLMDPENFDHPVVVELEALSSPASLNDLKSEILLAQTGYLTIKSRLSMNYVELGYPNQEVRLSLGALFSSELIGNQQSAKSDLAFWERLLANASLDEIVRSFNRVFQRIDFLRYPVKDEAGCRSHLQMLFIGAGLEPATEVHNAHGRSDLELDAGRRHWVFELKFAAHTAQAQEALKAALEQIESRRYGEASLGGRELKRAALVFSAEERRFAAWAQAPAG